MPYRRSNSKPRTWSTSAINSSRRTPSPTPRSGSSRNRSPTRRRQRYPGTWVSEVDEKLHHSPSLRSKAVAPAPSLPGRSEGLTSQARENMRVRSSRRQSVRREWRDAPRWPTSAQDLERCPRYRAEQREAALAQLGFNEPAGINLLSGTPNNSASTKPNRNAGGLRPGRCNKQLQSRDARLDLLWSRFRAHCGSGGRGGICSCASKGIHQH